MSIFLNDDDMDHTVLMNLKLKIKNNNQKFVSISRTIINYLKNLKSHERTSNIKIITFLYYYFINFVVKIFKRHVCTKNVNNFQRFLIIGDFK